MGHGVDFDADRDIAPLDGKVILLTGGNSGLGRESALALSKHNPSQLWITGRNAQAAQTTINEINQQAPDTRAYFLELDLASFDSIKKAAKIFLASASRLDILYLNAGIMGVPAGLTKEGYEVQFGTNHVGHALFLKLLTPLLLDTAAKHSSATQVRVIILSSVSHKFTVSSGIDFNTLKNKAEEISAFNRYGQSKLANLIYARKLANRYPQFTTVSVHPGVVKTEMNARSNSNGLIIRILQALTMPFISVSVQDGAKSQLWAATAKDLVSGEYYVPVGVAGKASVLSQDEELGQRLWEWTEEELKGHAV